MSVDGWEDSDLPCPTCEVQEHRIQALHANSAACMAENIRLKAENAGLIGSLESQQARLRPYTPDGLVAKEDVRSLYTALRFDLERLKERVNAESWKYAYDSLVDIEDTLDGYAYLLGDE